MSAFSDRPNAALLVIDVQNGVVEEAHNRDGVVANINSLVERARSQDVPVVWIQHSSEYLADTDLEEVLAKRRVGKLVVTGAQTDACVRSTIHGGLVRGYDVTLVGDAHTTEDLTEWGAPPPEQVIAHTNLYWDEQRAPGRRGGTVKTADVEFSSTEEG